MTIHHEDDRITLHHGDCLDVLRSMPDASVDSVVTDPPYGLEFMGKGWDAPWQEKDVNADAGFTPDGMGKGFTALPSYTGSSNPKCLNCKGTRRGRRDGTADRAVCMCEDGGRFPNTRAVEMRAFGQWCELWAAECLRVLKPGGHLLAFGGTRTWHRLACAVEDAGFEVRDSIAWLYGSGFSKGGLMGNKPGVAWCECGEKPLPYNHADNTDLPRVRDHIHPPAIARRKGDDGLLFPEVQRSGQGSGLGGARAQGASSVEPRDGGASGRVDARREEPGMGGRNLHRAGEGLQDGADAGSPEGSSEWLRGGTPARDGSADRAAGDAARGGASHQRGPGGQSAGEPEALRGSHGALDDGARRDGMGCPRCGGLDPAFRGFSTTLKPAFEPVVVARKPLVGTVAANVLTHGTGALNIDGTRIGTTDTVQASASKGDPFGPGAYIAGEGRTPSLASGRWPANVILDSEMAAVLDEQSGTLTTQKTRTNPARESEGGMFGLTSGGERSNPGAGETGGASRFFYVAKAPKRERPVVDGVAHPTVKPLALMRWLVRLVTPPGGTVLEPFAGSGTTVEACLLEDFRCIAIEKGDEYLPLILARIARQTNPLPEAAELVRTIDPDEAILEQIAGQLDIFGEGVA